MNSIQAIKGNGQIQIILKDLPNDALIQIVDNGCGIPSNILPKVFEPLFTTKQTGTGLGLTSCKKIVEQHHGVINVTSTENHGCTFDIILPKQIPVEKIKKLVASN
jgi:two-component system sensor histidine kinase HydH